MPKVFYAVTPTTGLCADYTRYANDTYGVYDLVRELTDDHGKAANAEGWAELACIGEIYEGSCFTVEIIED